MPWNRSAPGSTSDRIPVRSGLPRHFALQDALEGIEEVALAISVVSSLPDIVAAVARGAGRLPGSPSVTVGVVPRGGAALRLVALEGFDSTTLDRWGEIPLDMATPLTDVLRSGEPMYFESPELLLHRYPHLAPDVSRSGRQRWAAIPLVSPTEPSGVIGLGWADEHEFTEAERLFLLTLARLGGEALRRSSRDMERRDLLVMLADASDRERIEIARDLHDHSVQRLAAVLIRLGALRRDGVIAPTHQHALTELEREVQAIVGTLRDMIGNLHPPDMTGLHLDQAIDDLATWLFADRLAVTVVGGGTIDVTTEVGSVAYRIVQEALTNVAKHASASSVAVTIAVVGADLHLEISDDGVGFAAERSSGIGHIGVRTMTERAESMGGTITIVGDPSVTVTVVLPLRPDGQGA